MLNIKGYVKKERKKKYEYILYKLYYDPILKTTIIN